MTERSVVYCTNCAGEFIGEMDLSLNGNHEITCPLCQHVHYRVVRDGVVTEDRWRSSAGPIYFAAVSTTISFSGVATGTSTTLQTAWLSRSDLDLTYS